MIVGVMQPYFMPYLGYFQLMAYVDKYVIFDDVNYIKRGWSARNNILVSGQKHLFSISVSGGSQNNRYTDVVISDDFSKLHKTIEMSYKKAPYYNETMQILDNVFQFPDKRFNYFIKNSFAQILDYLGINTELILSSSLDNDKELKGQEKILDICKKLKADKYVNTIAGEELYDKQMFKENGMELQFLNTELTPYPQLNKGFVSGCSIIDVLMMNPVERIKELLKDFSLT